MKQFDYTHCRLRNCFFRRGNSDLLISLLHRDDASMNLLFHRDEEYGKWIQTNEPVENSYTSVSSFSVNSGNCSTFQNREQLNWQATQSIQTLSDNSALQNSFSQIFMSNGCLCGYILKRQQSKVIFKKWKQYFFVVNPQSLDLYKTINDWQFQRQPNWSLLIHPQMVILSC